ncbi:hypothetical protein BKK53_10505 [Rodentibacter trehalosifermentans]|nr:hypothetical protein BKK53_10505 [Rodentibacter trehalosifermentans]
MMKPKVYFAPWCPDTEPFFAELNRLKIEFEALDIANDRLNFKAFFKLRDVHPAFDDAKQNGYIGIPALVLENGNVVLDKELLNLMLS